MMRCSHVGAGPLTCKLERVSARGLFRSLRAAPNLVSICIATCPTYGKRSSNSRMAKSGSSKTGTSKGWRGWKSSRATACHRFCRCSRFSRCRSRGSSRNGTHSSSWWRHQQPKAICETKPQSILMFAAAAAAAPPPPKVRDWVRVLWILWAWISSLTFG